MRHNLNGEDGDPIISENAQKTRMNTKTQNLWGKNPIVQRHDV